MQQPKPACQNPQERCGNIHEVSLGFSKKVSSDESRRCPQCAQPSCLSGCPLGIDIPGFIRFLREGDAVSALERIKKDNPFPAICGRICPAPCESACIFHEEGSPIAIRTLERYAADFGRTKVGAGSSRLGPGNPAPTVTKKIAIVGSGPSAMAAAYVLLKDGFVVEMFEAANEPGGLLRYGIPEFRLPQNILDEQFQELQSLGLKLHMNVLVGRMKRLEELINHFDALLVALGSGVSDFASIEGENLAGVYYAEEFLLRLQHLSKPDIFTPARSVLRGNQTVVMGSGSAAFDAARMAVRLGQEVHLVFEGLEEEMGVSVDILRESTEEGVKILTPFEPLKIINDGQGNVQALQCQRLEIIESDQGLRLEAVKEEPTLLLAQTVVLVNSQKTNRSLVQPFSEKVFTTAGTKSVVDAFASGKAMAQKIIGFLKQ